MSKDFFNSRAAIWDEKVAEKDASRLKAMLARLDIKPGAAVLDVGTGTGVFISFLLERIGREGNLVCLDFAGEMLKIVQAKGFEGNISYLCADVTNIPLGNEHFDAIVCYSSFPHFQDKPAALAEMNRVIKPGGRLYVCHTSGRAVINGIHRQIPAVENDTLPGEGEMRVLLSAAGFSGIEVDDNSDSYLATATKP